jgi:glycosyltransferase involved in cell wall biosynthesis
MTDRVRLLTFVTNFLIGGTERQVVNLARGLDRERFDLQMACFQRTGDFLPEVESRGVPLTHYAINRLYGIKALRQQLRFGRHLRRQGIQVVHSYGFYPNIFAIPAARLARVPVVLASIRDTGDHLTSQQKRVQRLVCRLADRVLANSEAVRDSLLLQGYDPRRIVLIRNGIDVKHFGREVQGSTIRRELGIAEDAPIVAVLSRLNQLKGLEYFLEAAALLAPSFPKARFLIVGDNTEPGIGDAYRRKLQADAERLGVSHCVVFTGFRRDIPELLSQISISVLPSLSEGLSNALIEAMVAGVPVVATAVGGNAETVEHGVTGLLVAPRDSAALAAAVTELLSRPDLARRLGCEARERAVGRFSLERMLRETEGLYLRLVEEAWRRGGGSVWSPA